MTLTTHELEERKEQLRQEILERECILAALEVLHKHMTRAPGSRPIDIGALLPALLAHPGEMAPTRQVTLLASAPATLPPSPPPPRYIHPELEKIRKSNGSTTEVVRWAIARLTGDYTLRDIHALLAKEGEPLQGAEISVVLSRLKKRREIAEIQYGSGRKAAIFRKPPLAIHEPTEGAA